MCQLPGVTGDTGGSAWPRAWLTGFEKVSMIGVPGDSGVPGAGEATAEARAPAGNQLTSVAAALSHPRGAAATQTEPATPRWGTVTSLEGAGSVSLARWPGAP